MTDTPMQTDNQRELKPCPFCGGKGIGVKFTKTTFVINCRECGAGTSAICATEDEAAEAWNTRASAPAVEAPRELSADVLAALAALRFYADDISYIPTQSNEPRTAVHGDAGKRAVKALLPFAELDDCDFWEKAHQIAALQPSATQADNVVEAVTAQAVGLRDLREGRVTIPMAFYEVIGQVTEDVHGAYHHLGFFASEEARDAAVKNNSDRYRHILWCLSEQKTYTIT